MNRHLVAFSENVIEVWDLRTSERVQVVYGKEVRCLYNGPVLPNLTGCLPTRHISNASCDSGYGSARGGETQMIQVSLKQPGLRHQAFEMVYSCV